jgi:hypothetical protein
VPLLSAAITTETLTPLSFSLVAMKRPEIMGVFK